MIARRIDKAADVVDDFTHLAEYIAAASEDGEKLDQFWIANCDAGTGLADLDAATAEVEAVRMQKPEVANKTYHLVISLHPGEEAKLDKATLQDIVRNYAEALGFADHQYVAGSHLNTDNYHVHVAFNRVHPKTLKVHAPYNDFKALETVSRVLEKKYGLTVDRGMSDPKPETALSPGARDFEANTWQESFQRHVLEHRAAILGDLKAAATWQDVHDALARYDIRLKPHGAGLVLTDPSGRQTMKASALHRSCGKKALEARFGPFEPAGFALETTDETTGEMPVKTPAEGAPPPADERTEAEAVPTEGAPEPPAPATAFPEGTGSPTADADRPAPALPTEPAPHRPDEPSAEPPALPAPDQPPPPRPEARPEEAPPLRIPPVPVARYRPRPLVRRPGLAPLWRTFLQQRGRRRPTLLGKVARNWKMFLVTEAYSDPFAFVILMAHQEFLSVVLGEDEPAPPKRLSPEIAGALARWRAADRWRDAPETPWNEDRSLVSAGTRVDEAGNLVVPFRDAAGALQGVRLLAPSGRHLDIGKVGGPAMHIIDPKRALGRDKPVVVTTDYLTAVAIRRATGAPVVVAPSTADIAAVIVGLEKQHGSLRPVLAVAAPETADHLPYPRLLLPEKRSEHVLRSLFAAALDDRAMMAWDKTIDWAKPSNCAWLSDRQVPGFGVRVTPEGDLAVPLRTLAGRIEDVLLIDAGGDTRRVDGAPAAKPLVHVIDPRRRLGHGPVVIATDYAEAAAIHRATAAPVVMTADPAEWPEIAKALKAKHPGIQVVLAAAPEIAASAADMAAELSVTVMAEPIAGRTSAEHAKALRGVFAEALDDQVFLRWEAARVATREDAATHPWLAVGRVTAAARIDDAGDVLLPLRDGDLRQVGVLAVDGDGRERWRLDEVAADGNPQALFHVLGGWLGKNGTTPLVITDDLRIALAIHRESEAAVILNAGDILATITAGHRQLPGRRIVVISASAVHHELNVERLNLSLDGQTWRQQLQVALKAAKLELGQGKIVTTALPAQRL